MSSRVTTLVFWGGLVVALVVVAVAVTGDINREPLDPRSVSPDGARALVEVAERAGADVEIGLELPGDDAEVAVLLADTYGVAGRNELTDWVRRGGRLVIADLASPITPAPGLGLAGSGDGVGACPEPALAGINRITGFESAYAERETRDTRCFGGGVIIATLGDGVIVSIGGPGPLLNENLAAADNAALAVALLAPQRGTSVAFLEPRLAVAAGENLEDLVGDPVWLLLIQLAVGFAVVALWKARRIGRPVAEPVPVEIAGSELAAARGRLLAGLRNPAAAATELRADTRRTLARALGIAADTDLVVVATRTAERTGVALDDVEGLLARRPVATDADLLAVAVGLADLTARVDPTRVRDPRRPRSVGSDAASGGIGQASTTDRTGPAGGPSSTEPRSDP
ncbi:MAG: DUF4350 domain-containing protein [Acidimicrobiales bacterium]